MSSIKLTVHGIGSGLCSLMGKEGEGLTVSFDDGTIREGFLSWKAFRQLLALKSGQQCRPEAKPATPPPAKSATP